jgi:DNA repair exonuclease SbcCD ATPase subunit
VRDVRGRTYRIEWDFERHSVRLLDADTGADESGVVAGKGKEVRLGEHLLGIDLENFRGICCLDQIAISPVKRSDWLTNALQQAVASVTSDGGADKADASLKELVFALGFRTDSYRPTPTGRAKGLLDERSRLGKELERVREERDEVERLAARLAEQLRRQHELEQEAEQLRGRLLVAELEAAERRLDEARRLEHAARERPATLPAFPHAEASGIAELRARIAQVDDQIERLAREVERTREEVEGLEARRAELVPRRDALDVYESVDGSRESTVREAWAVLQALSPQAPAAEPRAAAPAGRGRRLLWLALVVATLGVAWLARRALRALAAWLARRAPTAASADESGSLERRLAAELDAAGALGGPALAERVSAYLRACEGRRELLEVGRELAKVESRLANLGEPRKALDRACRERSELESELGARYAAAGIREADLVSAAAELERVRRELEAAEEQVREADAAAGQLQTLLAGETIADLERRRDDLEDRLRAHEARHGGARPDPVETDEGRRRLEEVEGALGDAKGEVARLEAEIETRERDLGSPAELEELLSATEAVLARLELHRDAARLARETLRAAAEETHRAFAPHLNGALARTLPRITNGRYAEALVADDLSVKVRVPETGTFLDPSGLSRATQDQIFLVQRLEIARLLDPTLGAAPLFLDDPFARFDPGRLRLGLELLDEIAQARQVVLFSEDPALLELARAACSEPHVIRLPALEPGGAG